MKMEITYTCGHKGVINVTGDAKNRERQQWAAEHSDCPDCINKKFDEKNKAAGFAELQGSEKQISWAETIRQGFVEKLEAFPAVDEANKAMKEKLMGLMKNKKSAAWWIDNRSEQFANVIHKLYTEEAE